VRRRAARARRQSREERGLVDDGAAPDVDEDGAAREEPQLALADEAL